MINLKPRVFSALNVIDAFVSDQYPDGDGWEYPVIVYADEDNSLDTMTTGGERLSSVRYRVEIHSGKAPTTGLMIEVNTALAGLGLNRTMNHELVDPLGNRMRIMRFEGIYDSKQDRFYTR